MVSLYEFSVCVLSEKFVHKKRPKAGGLGSMASANNVESFASHRAVQLKTEIRRVVLMATIENARSRMQRMERADPVSFANVAMEELGKIFQAKALCDAVLDEPMPGEPR